MKILTYLSALILITLSILATTIQDPLQLKYERTLQQYAIPVHSVSFDKEKVTQEFYEIRQMINMAHNLKQQLSQQTIGPSPNISAAQERKLSAIRNQIKSFRREANVQLDEMLIQHKQAFAQVD